MKFKKSYLWALLIIFFVILGFISYFEIKLPKGFEWLENGILSKVKRARSYKQENWMTVFVHGTFNSGLGLLNLFDVLGDKVSGTEYSKVVKKMRKDPYFYQEQPILARGLIKINPSIDIASGDEHKLAIHPIVGSYEKILSAVRTNKELNYFYTFGWTGLMSQIARRKEALRFYNGLCEELEEFKRKGIKPKVRLIAHSHGGNVCLNLAAVSHVLKAKDNPKLLEDSNYKEAIKNMKEFIDSLPSKEEAKKLKGQKQFDYKPTRILSIDEFIAYGTPIQAETSIFFFSNSFKKSFNFYSEQDFVQKLDFITTKESSSKQRMSKDELEIADSGFIQARIMIERSRAQETGSEKESELVKEKEEPSFWQRLFSGSLFSDDTKDPTHKDLWFLAWTKEFTQQNYPFNPLPTVIFTSLFTSGIYASTCVNFRDLDLNLYIENKDVVLEVRPYNQNKLCGRSVLPLSLIDELKEKVLEWKPENLTREIFAKKIQTKFPT